MKNTTYTCFLFLIWVVLSTSCKSDIKGIEITGKVDSIDGTKVFLRGADDWVAYDSTIVKNNQFTFKSNVPAAGFYNIDFVSKVPFQQRGRTMGGWMHPCLVYLEANSTYEFKANGKYQILYNYYSINSSSSTQQKLNQYYKYVNANRKRYRELKKNYLEKADQYLEQGNNELYNKYTELVLAIVEKESQVYKESTYEFIKQNPNTLITPYLITKMSDFFENYALYRSVLDGLSPEVKETEYAKKANALLKATEKLRIGGDVPPIYGSDVNGKAFSYDYTKNKYTLIDLWASWCIPCRRQTPQLREIRSKYKSKGFDIIAVSVDERKDWWTRISKLDKISWYNVSESVKSKDSKNIENFVAKRLPLNYLVDQQGKIIGKELALDSLDKFLETSL